jgi:uncharacterized protein YeaO (DUF488 family)
MAIRVKRIYEKREEEDGFRILVDRLWPRGISKARAKINLWLRDAAPSTGLRKWFAHDPGKWSEFEKRYFKELEGRKKDVETIIRKSRTGNVTLLYGARDEQFNNAVALARYVEKLKRED